MNVLSGSVLVVALAVLGVRPSGAVDDVVPVAGRWRFALDRHASGEAERWFTKSLPAEISLPGSLAARGVGDEVTIDTKWTGGIVDRSFFTAPEYAPYRKAGNVKVPFWLQPEKYYAGVAWYQRDFEVPLDWQKKRVVLFLERVHWESRVWVDDRSVGTNNSLATPHEYDLGQLAPGKHTLSIRVDNRMIVDVGENSHCVSDHTQGNWNGIVGKIELRATPLVWIEDLQVCPQPGTKSVKVIGRIANRTARSGNAKLAITITPLVIKQPPRIAGSKTVSVEWGAERGGFETEITLFGEAGIWDEFEPTVYRLVAWLDESHNPGAIHDAKGAHFGLREVSTDGTQFTINGRKTFLRGTLDCCIFPKTGHPPMEVEEWRRIIRVAKSYGLNLIRFHSWCPPEAAFQAADELGFYFHVETCWPNQSTTLGDGKPVDQWIYDETDRILKYYGNHPSFLLMAAGNEPGGKNANAYLAKYVAHYKALDPRRLWTSGAGWPQLPENQFHVTPDTRIQSWGGGLRTRINSRPPETTTDYREYIAARTVPCISHEIGQWCVYPNFDEIKKYNGYLKPRNFEIFRDTLAAHHLGDLARQFLLASGKLQVLCYKEEIESALRTPGMGGFELLDLHDFPGQGTALVGVLDPFWEEKGYLTAQEFSRFCNSTVPLARLKKRVFTTDESLEAEVAVAHYGADTIKGAATGWRLVGADGEVLRSGGLPKSDIPVGACTSFGLVNIPLSSVPAPARYKLALSTGKAESGLLLNGKPGTAVINPYLNSWDVWVYPPAVDTSVPGGITVANELNDAALAVLKSGGKVLLLIPPQRVAPDKKHGKVQLGFSSIFWNTAWTQQQPPHTLGILCDPKHPLFAEFPTEFHSNWQWWYLVCRAGAMILDDFPKALRPTVQVIDDWFTARKLGLVVEAKFGKGRLMICSVDLEQELADDPVRRQFRHSLLRYMASNRFAPQHTVTAEQVHRLMVPVSTLNRVGVRSFTADSEEEGFEAGRAVDGDPNTFWHTKFRETRPDFPHEFVLRFDHPIRLAGFTALPRQDGNQNGWIQDYAFHVSMEGRDWGEPLQRGRFPPDQNLKTIRFGAPVTARYVRLVALSGFDQQPFASLAEFDVIQDGF